MVSERIQRRIERLLDESEASADQKDWPSSAESAREALPAKANRKHDQQREVGTPGRMDYCRHGTLHDHRQQAEEQRAAGGLEFCARVERKARRVQMLKSCISVATREVAQGEHQDG